MIQLIVCDWDGTIVDSVSKIIKCKKFLAEKYNLPVPSAETVKNVLGTKFENALAMCFPSVSREMLLELGEEFHGLMKQDSYQSFLFPEVQLSLSALKKKGIKLAVATSKNRNELSKALDYTGLSSIFDITCCGKEFKEKPDPAMLLYIMEKFNVHCNECVMVGDTTTDMIFGRNAGIEVIGVTFGAHSITKLQTANPYKLINKWSNLQGVIDELCCKK